MRRISRNVKSYLEFLKQLFEQMIEKKAEYVTRSDNFEGTVYAFKDDYSYVQLNNCICCIYTLYNQLS